MSAFYWGLCVGVVGSWLVALLVVGGFIVADKLTARRRRWVRHD